MERAYQRYVLLAALSERLLPGKKGRVRMRYIKLYIIHTLHIMPVQHGYAGSVLRRRYNRRGCIIHHLKRPTAPVARIHLRGDDVALVPARAKGVGVVVYHPAHAVHYGIKCLAKLAYAHKAYPLEPHKQQALVCSASCCPYAIIVIFHKAGKRSRAYPTAIYILYIFSQTTKVLRNIKLYNAILLSPACMRVAWPSPLCRSPPPQPPCRLRQKPL